MTLREGNLQAPTRHALDWRNPDPFPKAFIRLALASLERGENFWDQTGVSMFYENRRPGRGEPPREDQEAISVLAQIVRKPFKVYYHLEPDGDLMVMEYEP